MVSSLSILLLFLFIAPIICLPFKLYNQRQDGELNVHAQLDNFIIVLVPTSGINWVDITAKAKPYNPGGSGNVLQIFNKSPSASTSPYKVDIDNSNVPLDKVSDEPVENETIGPPIQNDHTEHSVRFTIASGGNIYNNEVTKQTSTSNDDSGSNNSNDDSEKLTSQDSENVQENENNKDGTKDSNESKLAFSSTVSAQLDLLTPERKIPVAASVQQTSSPSSAPPVQEQNNVIIGKAFKNARFFNTNSEEKKFVKILQSGLEVCSPGQRLTPKGECVDAPAHRER